MPFIENRKPLRGTTARSGGRGSPVRGTAALRVTVQ